MITLKTLDNYNFIVDLGKEKSLKLNIEGDFISIDLFNSETVKQIESIGIKNNKDSFELVITNVFTDSTKEVKTFKYNRELSFDSYELDIQLNILFSILRKYDILRFYSFTINDQEIFIELS